MKILLAVDDSSYSACAVEAVAARPWPEGTTVRVLTVFDIDLPPGEVWDAPVGVVVLARDELRRRGEQLTSGVVETLLAGGLTAETAVREGDPQSVIVGEAEEWSADLVVVGSHGYTGIKRLLLGSVARAVVDHAPCSVEVVRRKRGGGS